MYFARTGGVPHVHVLKRTDASLLHTLPDTQPGKNLLRGATDGRYTQFVGIIGPDIPGIPGFDHGHLKAAIAQGTGQGRADHATTNNQYIEIVTSTHKGMPRIILPMRPSSPMLWRAIRCRSEGTRSMAIRPAARAWARGAK